MIVGPWCGSPSTLACALRHIAAATLGPSRPYRRRVDAENLESAGSRAAGTVLEILRGHVDGQHPRFAPSSRAPGRGPVPSSGKWPEPVGSSRLVLARRAVASVSPGEPS